MMEIGLLIVAMSFAATPVEARSTEANLIDGRICCGLVQPMLFDRDGDFLVSMARPGLFKLHGEVWTRAMNGLIAPNGVEPFVISTCQSPSSPRIVYALGGNGFEGMFTGIWRSSDFGRHWEVGSELPLSAFSPNTCSVDPGSPDTVYVSSIDGSDPNLLGNVWKSVDGAHTFRSATGMPPLDYPGMIAVAPDGSIFLTDSGTYDGVYWSQDGGASFQRLAASPQFPQALFVQPGTGVVFVTDGSNILYRSTDAGATFQIVAGLPPDGPGPAAVTAVGFDPNDSRVVYASSTLLYRSVDGGQTFTLVLSSVDSRFDAVAEIGVDGRSRVYISTNAGAFRSDEGERFEPLRRHLRAPNVTDLAFDASGRLLVGVYHTYGVYRAGGRGYDALGDGFRLDIDNDVAAVAGSPSDENVILAAPVAQQIMRTSDGGKTWSAVAGGPDYVTIRTRFAFPTSSRVYVVTPNFPAGLWRSDDAGATFTQLSPARLASLAVDPFDADHIVLSGLGIPRVYESTDAGATLRVVSAAAFNALFFDRFQRGVLYGGTRAGGLLRSTDGGATWTTAGTGLAGTVVWGIGQDSQGTLYTWLRGGGLFFSADRAVTWAAAGDGESLSRSGAEGGKGGALAVDPLRPGRVYLGHTGLIQVDLR